MAADPASPMRADGVTEGMATVETPRSLGPRPTVEAPRSIGPVALIEARAAVEAPPTPVRRVVWRSRRGDDQAGGVTTRLGFAIILAGVVLIVLRAVSLVDTELADIASVLAIVVGALAVAVDGEAADRKGS